MSEAWHNERTEKVGWLIVAGIAVITFAIMGGTISIVAILLPHVIKEFGSSSGQASVAMSLFGLGMVLASWPAGWLSDRINPRPVMLSGVGLIAGGCLIGLAASNMTIIAGALAMIGVGVGATVTVPATMIISSWISTRRATALGIMMCASAAGTAILPLVTSELADTVGWRAVMGYAAIAVATITAPVIVFVARMPPHAVDGIAVMEAAGDVGAATLGASLLSRDFVLLTLALSFSGAAYAAMFYHSVLFLNLVGLPNSQSALAFSAMNVSAFVGYLLVGVLADKIGIKRLLTTSMFLASLAVLSLFFVQYPVVRSCSIAIFVLLWGMTSNQAAQLTPALFVRIATHNNLGTLMGASFFVSGVIAVSGPFAMGTIKDVTGSYDFGLLLCATFMGLAGLSSWYAGSGREERPDGRAGIVDELKAS